MDLNGFSWRKYVEQGGFTNPSWTKTKPMQSDGLMWSPSPSGSFQSNQPILRKQHPIQSSIVLFPKAILRHAFSIWPFRYQRLYTLDKLLQWEQSNNCCYLHVSNLENFENLFFQCPWWADVWSSSSEGQDFLTWVLVLTPPWTFCQTKEDPRAIGCSHGNLLWQRWFFFHLARM